jgi:tetratricopeptide (TPR) repeat protein
MFVDSSIAVPAVALDAVPSVPHGFTAFLYRPYFDLGPVAASGPVAAWGVEFACRAVIEQTDYPWMYAEYPPSFRDRLIQLTGLTEYRVHDARELPADLRTERWQMLCEHVEDMHSLTTAAQARVARLLGKLGLYEFLLEIVDPPSDAEIANSDASAELAYLRALADFLIDEDHAASHDEVEFERIATRAPRGSHVRILALNHLAVRQAKGSADVERAGYWLELHGEEIERARSIHGEAMYARLMSRHHRAKGFLPQLGGDRLGVVREMDLCQQFAERVPRDAFTQRIAADELLFAALESRTKEALWLGDLDAAEERARRLVGLWPMDPLAHDHLGQVLVERERIEEALGAYLSAARIGAPSAEADWFMAGQCYEALELLERACDAYLTAVRLDPLGMSSLERLAEVAEDIRQPELATWSRARLRELQGQRMIAAARPQLAAYQQYRGKLGGAQADGAPNRNTPQP